MRILSKHYLCFAFVVTTIILQGSRAFAELRAGDTVIAKEATDLKLSGKVVGKVRAGDLLLVGEVRGAWVNVGGKKPGWVHADNLLRDAAAIEQLSTQIENEPSAARLLARARILLGKNQIPKAERDLARAEKLESTNAEIQFLLAKAALANANTSRALECLGRAIEMAKDVPEYYRERLKLLEEQGRLAEQVNDMKQLARLEALDAQECNKLAWWLATAIDGSGIQRDGKLAVKYADKACELTGYDNYAFLDTLAAAYAEQGDFPNAIIWQEKAIDACDITYQKRDCEMRLKMYKKNQPYREYPE